MPRLFRKLKRLRALIQGIRAARRHFDPAFYRTRNRDLSGGDLALFRHYMNRGWREGRDPCAWFSTRQYLAGNTDVAASGANPFLHYVRFGKAEGRPPSAGAQARPLAASEISADDANAVAGHFDAAFYRNTYEDMDDGDDRDLLNHYLMHGWREGRDPCPWFSTRYYLETYEDIETSGANPFLHYVLFGKAEGRRAHGSEPLELMNRPDANQVPGHLAAVLTRAGPPAVAAPETVNPNALTIHWIVPDFARGGGGHMTIFRMIRFLEIFGHRCKIWIERPDFHASADAAYQDIIKYFKCVGAEVAFADDGLYQAAGDILIATSWSTAYLAEAARGFAAKFYFVQDHEPEFHPTGTESLLAKRTYGFDFACICASPWLAQMMSDVYGRWARHFYLACDHTQYRLLPAGSQTTGRCKAEKRPFRIAVYAREHTARRCVMLIVMALQILGRTRSDFTVNFFGQEMLPFNEVNYRALNHGVLNADRLAQLYGQCDLGLCFSATNYSLIPQEMMACGLPVLELDVPSNRQIFPPDVVTLAGPHPQDIAAAIGQLLDDPDRRAAQSQAAHHWVSGFSWEASARGVEAAIQEFIAGRPGLAAPAALPARGIRMDVVIPTYNGIGEIEATIKALRGQRLRDEIAIWCIDSSSTDGTTEWLRKQKDLNLTVIDQKDFQHGRTRNLGAAQGSAQVIAFLTQDAIPATEDWATDILMMMDHYPEAAGLFGRHRPYPDHPEYVRQDITNHFANMLKHPIALSRDTDPERWNSGDRGWRQLLHFYSDNNSAMRRAVWEKHPYPEIDYGEDQIWARDIIAAGYTKLYAPTATVYHSHDYTPQETYARSKVESAFFFTHFDYRLGDGTLAQIEKSIAREQKAFRNWARQRDVGADETERRLKNISAKYHGWRDGLAESEGRTPDRT